MNEFVKIVLTVSSQSELPKRVCKDSSRRQPPQKDLTKGLETEFATRVNEESFQS